MSYRTIEINGRDYRFKIGKSFVEIRTQDNVKHLPTCSAVRGEHAEAIRVGRKYGLEEGMITPRHVREWIEKNAA